jgi:hypothetical protein
VRKAGLLCLILSLAFSVEASAQRRRAAPARKPPPPPVPLTTAAADVKCPESLGTGLKTRASFCFVLAGREPGEGVIVAVPPHTGPATLMFDLHNRHTYSEEDVRAGQGFAKYTAVVAVLSMKGDLLGRGAVQTEFRTAQDLYDRVSGGAGPGGVKAVAPLGKESITITIPAGTDVVSLLGEVLDATTVAGHETATPGRTVAIVSNVRIEYRPARPAPAPARPRPR